MKIVVFTSSFPRHKYLVSQLSKNFEKVIYVCEKKPYIRSEITKKKREYFNNVKKAERKIFKKIFFKKNIKKINFFYGKLNLKKLLKLSDFRSADRFLVFGSSYIKGELFNFLKKKKAINIHMGVMPYYRGTDCNFWAIYDKNFKYVGATLMRLSKKIDDGRIISIFKMQQIIKNNFFNFSMKACKLSINLFVNKIVKKKDSIFLKINKFKLLRYSKKKDFNDEAIKVFYEQQNDLQKKY